jgi:dihydrofolate synthase/folylpolyglutamate synthase
LDATNVVDAAVAIVTGVDIDHEAVLGSTAQQIAFEKAGIFKPGRAAVVGASGLAAAVPHLAAHARAAGTASLHIVGDVAVPVLGLVGAHQRRNAAAALAAIAALQQSEHAVALRFTPALIRAGLASVQHPGRFEQLPGSPTVILDGAHNVAGAQALAECMIALPNYLRSSTALVIAVSADKQVPQLLAALLPYVGLVVATRYQQDRAKSPTELAALCAAGHRHVAQADTLAAAMAIAQAAPTVTHIIVAGSLFLVGEARTLLCGAATDPWVVTDPMPRIAT